MKRSLFILLLGLIVYVLLMGHFTSYLQQRPVVEKLGYNPSAHVLKFLSADQGIFLGNSLVMKVLFYYGGLVEARNNQIVLPIDYDGMLTTLNTATLLDPYNMDAYYFAQAILTWDADRLEGVNSLLEHGAAHRDWDFYLPYFLGFNYSYFLGNAKKAAPFYQQAADLTGYDLFARLAGRYMYEAGQTELAISYLKTMIPSAHSETVKQSLLIRLKAFEAVLLIESARDAYVARSGEQPVLLEDLIEDGFLLKLPVDPYGGDFYLDEQGRVKTTSLFTYKLKREQQ